MIDVMRVTLEDVRITVIEATTNNPFVK